MGLVEFSNVKQLHLSVYSAFFINFSPQVFGTKLMSKLKNVQSLSLSITESRRNCDVVSQNFESFLSLLRVEELSIDMKSANFPSAMIKIDNDFITRLAFNSSKFTPNLVLPNLQDLFLNYNFNNNSYSESLHRSFRCCPNLKTIDDSEVEDFVCKLNENVKRSVVMKSSKKSLREEVVITAAHDISDLIKPNLEKKKVPKPVKTPKQEKSKQLGSTMVKLKKSLKMDMGKKKKEVLKKEILSSKKKVKSIKVDLKQKMKRKVNGVTTNKGTDKSKKGKAEERLKVQEKRTRRKRCGACKGCLASNCGNCKYCLDMTQYGGKSTLRKPCVSRVCSKYKDIVGKKKIKAKD